MKRAIALGGGGPAAGLHIGVLQHLAEAGITFDVWALSCIGAWVGLVYNQFDKGSQPKQTYTFFHDNVFRDDVSYSRFPVNTVFGPDLTANTRAMMGFLFNPQNYKNLVLPAKMADAFRETVSLMSDPNKWNEGDFNHWMLDQVMAVNPLSRFLTSLLYLSDVNGLSRIYYPNSSFLKGIDFEKLYEADRPFIYHNAWNLTKQRLELFSNKQKHGYKQLTAQSLCACSALPFIEETIEMDGDTYCEGALVDTVNFKNLVEDHPDLDEVWVSRIVDVKQVRAPRNIHDALGNLCMLFAAALGDDDVKLFRYHIKEDRRPIKIVEIKVSSAINFDWTHSNLENGRKAGYAAVGEALKDYRPDVPV